jgi:hypothetical protein
MREKTNEGISGSFSYECRSGRSLPFDVDSGLIESSVDVVNRNRVVGVRSIARNINDNPQLTFVTDLVDGFSVDEGRNFGGEVDTVDENVGFENFGERSSL